MTDTTERAERQIALMADYLRGLKDDHTPDGYPAVRMSTLTECEDMLRTQSERIAELEAELLSRGVDPAFAPLASNLAEKLAQVEAERDQLREEVEMLRADGERIDYLEYEANELRTRETGEDDYEWVVRSNHMDQPHERDVAHGKTIREAIDAARKDTP